MHRALALTLVFMACTVGSLSASAESQRFAIIDGEVATLSQLYGTVALMEKYGEQFCTGTLIAPTVIVTAAHCFFDPDTGERSVQATDLEIGAGVIKSWEVQPDQLFDIEVVALHAQYDGYSEDFTDPHGMYQGNDLALLVTKAPVKGVNVVPVLPAELVGEVLVPGQTFIITGYGVNDMESGEAGELFIAETQYDSHIDSELVLGGAGNPDTCSGDSGGPAYVEHDGTLYVVGATSRGVVDAMTDCGSGGIYTLLPFYLQWLIDNSQGGYEGGEGIPDDPENPDDPEYCDESEDPDCYYEDDYSGGSDDDWMDCSVNPNGRRSLPESLLLLFLACVALTWRVRLINLRYSA